MKELIIVKLGNEDRPASQEDIDNLAKSLKKAIKKGKNIVITHHAIEFERVPLDNVNKVQIVAASETVV